MSSLQADVFMLSLCFAVYIVKVRKNDNFLTIYPLPLERRTIFIFVKEMVLNISSNIYYFHM